MKNRYWLSLCLMFVAVSLCGLVAVNAQQEPPQKKTQQKSENKTPPPQKGEPNTPEGQEPKTDKIITYNVRLPITVLEKETNRFVTDLKQEDFEIYEDKVKQTVISFRPESDQPLDVAVLMDTSNSVSPKLKFEKDAAISFIETVLKSRRDRALFATFDSEIELHQDYTNRMDLLSKAITKVKAHGATKLHDAVYRVCEEKMSAPIGVGRRRTMVVITDGQDTESERTLAEAISIAQRTETVIFVISTKSGGFFGVQAGQIDSREDKDLKRIAEETGGRAFFTGSVIELEKSFSAIARELRSQYLVAYQPSNENFDGKFRKIEVRLPGRKNLKLRVKEGYNAVRPDVRAGLK